MFNINDKQSRVNFVQFKIHKDKFVYVIKFSHNDAIFPICESYL